LIQNNDENKAVKKLKLCPNSCGKLISYNARLNVCLEVDTGMKHKCPNLNQKVQTNFQHTTKLVPAEEVKYIDTWSPLLAEMLRLLEEIRDMLERIIKSHGYLNGN